MNLEALGNLGEIVGGAAVVISLVFLVFQLRQNTRSIRSATHQAVVTAAAATNQALSSDPALARVLRLGTEGLENLDPDEQVQFGFLCMQFFDLFENLHLQWEHGVLDDDFWEPRRRAYLQLLMNDGFQAMWSQNRLNYSGRFRAMVDEGLTEGHPRFRPGDAVRRAVDRPPTPIDAD